MKIPATTLLIGSLLLGGCSTAPALTRHRPRHR